MKLIAGIAAAFAFLAVITYGWVMNIIMIAHSNFAELTGILILRVVGIFIAPLGVVMGYI